MPLFTPEELEELQRADQEIEGNFQITQEEINQSRKRDRDAALESLDHHHRKIAARKAAYYEANREKIAARNAAYREANREKIAARQAAYYEANREKITARNAAYREANREKLNAYNREYRREMREKQKKAASGGQDRMPKKKGRQGTHDQGAAS